MTAQNEDEVREVLEEGREYLDEEFLQAIEDTALDLEQAGRAQTAERLRGAAVQIAEMIGAEEVET